MNNFRTKTRRMLRLQVYMARCGAGSRRHCEKLIEQGRVTVNGKSASLGKKVLIDDQVILDGKHLKLITKRIYIAVNKPRGYICSNIDKEDRPLVSDLFRDAIETRLFHVGRLDFLTSGLIFYTNDGNFARIITHPSSGIEKEYLVETEEDMLESVLLRYQKGIMVNGESFHLKRHSYKTSKKVLLTLIEGKNREIRKVFSRFKITIRRIHRVRIGCVSIKGIPIGGFRFLTPKEIQWCLKQGQNRNDGSCN